MAEMTIRLQYDPVTGKRDIIVTLKSEDDSLPLEHEQQHRQLVDKLVHGGILKASEVGKIVVEREEEEDEPETQVNSTPQAERRAVQEPG